MERTLTPWLFLCAITIPASGLSLPTMQWSHEDIEAMALLSIDRYNEISGEDAVYALVGNSSRYLAGERFHQIHFTIKETECRKPHVTVYCDIIEGGMEKSCAAAFLVPDDWDVSVINCDHQPRELRRVRRSKARRVGRSGRNGRRGGRDGRRRPGLGSAIAGVSRRLRFA